MRRSTQEYFMADWKVQVEDGKVIITHKNGSGVVVVDSEKSTIAECILARFASDFKRALEA